MRTARTVAEVRAAVAQARRSGHTVALVPTMGAFHEGHLSLIRRARADCDFVVVSLFVNPTQFNDAADLDAYPRNERRDAALARDLGADLLFAPPAEEMYCEGFATQVTVGGVALPLEGEHRGGGHFDGVATVVVKLLNIVAPDEVYFGHKDAQQTAVVKRVVRDLNIPVSVRSCPTVRAPDGLALSSRNVLLAGDERVRATSLHRALSAAAEVVEGGERDPAVAVAAGLAELRSQGIEPDYFELVDPDTFTPVRTLRGDVLAVVAASLKGARLIDNLPIHAPSPQARDGGDNTIPTAANERPMKLAHPAA